MRIMKHAGKTVLVMSGDGDTCPRMSVVSSSVKLRDDYKGSFKTSSRLLSKIIQLG